MVDSIKLALRTHSFRAGDLRIGYQSCDDTVGDIFDEAVCAADAKRYVADSDVLGVIGTYNSGCAVPMLPILSRRAAGPLAMISPANTYVGLTRAGAGVCCVIPACSTPTESATSRASSPRMTFRVRRVPSSRTSEARAAPSC